MSEHSMAQHQKSTMPTFTPVGSGLLQRKCACGQHTVAGGECAECRKKRLSLQRRPAGQATPSSVPPIVHEVLRSPGQPLDPTTCAFIESRFGHDFSQVRVHTDAKAAESARAVNALAYTVGRDVVFEQGQYRPGTAAGKRLLAHELAHTVQQGLQENLARDDLEISIPSDAPEIESERVAAAALAGQSVHVIGNDITRLARRPPPAPTTEDCLPWQNTMLTNHLDHARRWVNDAERLISGYARVAASPRFSAVPRRELAEAVEPALRDNFHTLEPPHVRAIAAGFASLRAELNSALTFECEDEGCESYAYVQGKFSWMRRLSDIHVCPRWFHCRDYFQRVTTLIHERAHQYPGATEIATEWEPSYSTLAPDDAIDNAESYAVAARQIYHRGARSPGMPPC